MHGFSLKHIAETRCQINNHLPNDRLPYFGRAGDFATCMYAAMKPETVLQYFYAKHPFKTRAAISGWIQPTFAFEFDTLQSS